MVVTVLMAVGALALGAASHFTQQTEQVRAALTDGQTQLAHGDWEGAIHTLERGRALARSLPLRPDLVNELTHQFDQAEQARNAAARAAAVAALHRLADRIRFLDGRTHLSGVDLQTLETSCRQFWEQRDRVAQRLGQGDDSAEGPGVRDDLLDVALFWADLQERQCPPAEREEARRRALAIIAEAEALVGPSPVLDQERERYGAVAATTPRPPRTAWEHCALGRSLLRAGDLDRAASELQGAVALDPQGFWPSFYQGLGAYRQGRYWDAITACSVCIGKRPEAEGCYYNRALAWTAVGRLEKALQDYDQALRLDPSWATAVLNRGLLHFRAGHYDQALTDIRMAGKLGADPAAVSFSLALVRFTRQLRSLSLPAAS
jgi:tetratricopeptide (TPR) repeat protein